MDSTFQLLKHALEAGTATSALVAIFLAYLGGILSSFTPCIYPMIPITVGYIGGSTEKSLKDGWKLSSFYVLGMSMIYSALGVIASLSGKIFGSLTNTTGWYLSLGIILILASLWMLDVIQFDPNVLMHKIMKPKAHHGKPREPGVVGAFFLGASSGFIAAPCTTPVLTTILSFIATQKSPIFGGLLMFAFAMGLGTILVVLGTFAGALKLMPRSGRWMQTVKIASGLLILALAEYFVFKAGTYR